MVARGPGAVGCAHCLMVGADRACQICTHLVCERCAADWTTCGEPSGRVVRLGLTARVRDVDPTGQLALVSHWRQALRLFDLRQLRWIEDLRVPRSAWLFNRHNPPRLDSRARVTYGEWSASGSESGSYAWLGLRRLDLRRNTSAVIFSPELQRGAAMTAVEDRFYYVSGTEQVVVVDGPDIHAFDPLPRKVIQAVHLDGERNLLASTSWSEVVLHRLVDGKLERLSHRTTERTGDVTWVGLGGPWLVLATQNLGPAAIAVHRLTRDDSIGEVVHRHVTHDVRTLALSRDGRYLAFGTRDGLVVQALDSGDETLFTEHTDRINLVRFAGDDHVLISADTDNRVVLRPRTPAGYARPLVPIDIPEAGVPLPQQIRADRV